LGLRSDILDFRFIVRSYPSFFFPFPLSLCPLLYALCPLLYLTRSNSPSACSPATRSSKTRPLGSNSVTRNVRSDASLPGISSALNTTFMPGRAHVFGALRRRRSFLFRFTIIAPIAPSAPAAIASPPNSCRVRCFMPSIALTCSKSRRLPDTKKRGNRLLNSRHAAH